jgi:flagellar hook protein FlgE
MLDTINIGITGLQGFSRGLKVIANNTANMNTPGYKSGSLQFSTLFEGSADNGQQGGNGLNTGLTALNFTQGELQQSSNGLDMAIDGLGLFMLKGDDGNIVYSRSGQFEFNGSGVLVNRADGKQVLGVGADGTLAPISLAGLHVSAATPTSTVTFTGNLSNSQSTLTVNGVKVLDATGMEHDLTATFQNNGGGSWGVTLKDGTTTAGTGTIKFNAGQIDPSASKFTVQYTPAGMGVMPVTFDFGSNVTSFAAGSLSTLAMDTQNGMAAGALTKSAFDSAGQLVLTYSNGQTVKGAKLALSRFDAIDDLGSVGDNEFSATNPRGWHVGTAGSGSFGSIKSGFIEMSNVDLSQEFSNLVIVQRGYQASSQIISTANDMLQELFSLKGK